MANYDTTWYCNSVGYTAVPVWVASTAVAAGVLRRQTAPAYGAERVFICIIAGTTGATEPAWVTSRGAKTVDSTVTWMECTGMAAVNGDAVNTVNWAAVKAAPNPSLGVIIKRNNGVSYQICTTAGSIGATEPAFSDVAGATTVDSTITWTCIGAVGVFTGGMAPHARLPMATVGGWFVAGNTVYVGNNHAETTATSQVNIQPAANFTTVGKILCHNAAGSYPPGPNDLRTGATASTTSTQGLIIIPSGGAIYVYGLALRAGVGQTSGAITIGGGNVWLCLDNCSLEIPNTGNSVINFAQGSAGVLILNNTTVRFGDPSQRISLAQGQVFWQNTSPLLVPGSAIPTNFMLFNTAMNNLVFEALDMSMLTNNLFQANAQIPGNVLIKDCKLNAALTILGQQTLSAGGLMVQTIRSDSGTRPYTSARYTTEGTETTETGIVRVGGAIDPTGQAQSRKIITAVNAQWAKPFRAEPFTMWNTVVGAPVTITICGLVFASALPNNDDIWLEIEYPGSASSVLGSIVNTSKANILSTNAPVPADSSTWNNAGEALDLATGTGVSLSPNNLVATLISTGTNCGIRGYSPRNTGKYYFEILKGAVSGSNAAFGLLITSSSLAAASSGNANGNTIVLMSGSILTNNTNPFVSIGTFANGDICCIAVDFDARLVWLRRNNGIWNNNASANPATGVGGLTLFTTTDTWAPMALFGSFGTLGDSMTANFGATAFSFAAPSGFGIWPATVPFKMTATLNAPQPGMIGHIHTRVRAAKPNTTFFIDPLITLG